ncbi:MAG: TonB-dependent receptor [Vicinamibacteria bacterium]
MPLRRLRAFALLALAALAPFAYAQSTAINGAIEGTVKDTTGAVMPGVTVTLTNVETGAQRTVISTSSGSYRALLLPLGSYRVRAELQGFKTTERTNISLSAGQTATVDLSLEVGGMQEVVSISAEAPIADPGKIDLGRTISETEIKNLPNVSRNMYNFALLQPNVTGYENEEFGATRMNANGSQMRTNYQIDGGSATQKDRAGLRMFQPSEIMVKEVKVITSGFAPEFGQTTGMVYNAVSPSGTNDISGSASYRFRRQSFASRPFLLAPTAPKPDLKVDNFYGTLGGPIIKDKLHFYAGYERLKNDLSAGRVITVTQQTAQTLGLSAEALGDGVIPAIQTVDMAIAKLDYQLSPQHRLSARYSLFKNSTPENIGGGLNTREIATDFKDKMTSMGLQLVSSFGADKLNELRVAYGKRDNPNVPSAVAGSGPAVTVTGVANFGGAPTPTDFIQEYTQIVDNFSIIKGRHNIKLGFDVQFISDERRNNIQATYVFPNTAAYLAAKSGAAPFGYTRFTQAVGDPTVAYDSTFWGFFVQDDFRVSSSFKILYGVRYDLFQVPDADSNAPFPGSRSFKVDKNNIAPRVGFSWALGSDAKTVLRASSGVMYETPLLMFYQDALFESGAPKLLTASVTPTQTGAPAFPGTLSSLPPGVTPSQSIRTVASDFDTQYAILSNVQLERALTDDISATIGYVNSTGRSLPLLLNSNGIPTAASLGDGRPIYARSPINASTRVDPAFDIIREVRSSGRSQYNALTLSLNRRLKNGYQFQASYTLADAKEVGVIGGRYVIGSTDVEAISDPSNQDLDYGYTAWNVTHTFIVSGVLAPQVEGESLGAKIANNNQLAFTLQANSGLPFNIRTNVDRNGDGISADRPNGIDRQSGELGRFFNVDARYSRFIPLHKDLRAELFVEAKNIFNTRNVRAVNSIVTTTANGDLAAPLPAEFPVTSTYEQRQMQLGVKLIF